MSGGQKRRLDIVMGLIHDPTLVFLDEPTTGLDPQARANLWEHIARLRSERGATVFLTTHYLDEADALSDRIVIIDQGRIVASDTSDNLKAQVSGDLVTLEVAADDVSVAAEKLATVAQSVRTSRHPGLRPRGPRRPRRTRPAPRRRGRRRGPRVDRGAPPDPRRRVPDPHRPFAARRRVGGRQRRGERRTTGAEADPRRSECLMSTFLRETYIVFRRQLRMNLRNPAWVIIGALQPILYLLLFGPLLKPLVGQFGAHRTPTRSWCPGCWCSSACSGRSSPASG